MPSSNYQSELKYLLEEPDRLKTIADLVRQVNATGNTLCWWIVSPLAKL
jgi:hypothetical protein